MGQADVSQARRTRPVGRASRAPGTAATDDTCRRPVQQTCHISTRQHASGMPEPKQAGGREAWCVHVQQSTLNEAARAADNERAVLSRKNWFWALYCAHWTIGLCQIPTVRNSSRNSSSPQRAPSVSVPVLSITTAFTLAIDSITLPPPRSSSPRRAPSDVATSTCGWKGADIRSSECRYDLS